MTVEKFVVGVMRTNCYLVYEEGRTDAVLIDPGRSHARIEARLAELNRSVTAVLLTHGHFDHILDVGFWQSKGAKVYIHRLDADKLYTDKNLGVYCKVTVPETHADVTVEDGETLNLAGMEFKVMQTPGHSSGSVVYLIDDTMFSGDTLFYRTHGRVDFPDGSPADMVKSLKKLFALDGDYRVLPGHDRETTLSEEKRYQTV